MTNTSHSERKPQLVPQHHLPLWCIISSQLPRLRGRERSGAAAASVEKGRFPQGARDARLQGEGLCFVSGRLVDAFG